MERRLAAILAADIVGYSRLMGADEAGTVAVMRALREDLFDPLITRHNGRIVKLMGDGTLVEFASVVDAVNCAVKTQAALAQRNSDLPDDQHVHLRIGINLGDVIVQDDDLFGDGVNVAARLEGIADPGGICVSAAVAEQARGKATAEFLDMGEQTLKNIAQPVRVFHVFADPGIVMPDPPAEDATGMRRVRFAAIGVLLILSLITLWWEWETFSGGRDRFDLR